MLVVSLLLTSVVAFSQTESARISGRVTDQTDAVIVGAQCKITNIDTNVSTATLPTKTEFMSSRTCVPPLTELTIQKEGFRTVVQPSLQLYVQDAVNENFTLALGLTSEISTVVGAQDITNRLGSGQYGRRPAVRPEHAAEWPQLPVPDRADARGRVTYRNARGGCSSVSMDSVPTQTTSWSMA